MLVATSHRCCFDPTEESTSIFLHFVSSDQEPVDAIRHGRTSVAEELWRRHYKAGVKAAAAHPGVRNADDDASEAFVRVLEQTSGGKGPKITFHPGRTSLSSACAVLHGFRGWSLAF